MPKYRFDFSEDAAEERYADIDLADDDAAIREATRTAREILADGNLEGIDRRGWHMEVRAEDGRVVLSADFADLLKKPGSLA